MSQHITKYTTILLTLLMASLAVAAGLTGCTDKLLYEPEEIPDAEVELTGEVIFKPLVPMEVTTRSQAPQGADYSGIRSLHILFFDREGNIINDYCGEVDFTIVPPRGSDHVRATFRKKVQAGYYYVFAVANISSSQKSALMKVADVDELRNFRLEWNGNLDDDLEMFGVFNLADKDTPASPGNETFESDQLLAITPKNSSIQSWVRRATSKVTVDFDGSALVENVTIFIRNATLKDVASGALLGAPSAAGANDITCTASDYCITYGPGEDHNAWPTVTKRGAFAPSDVWADTRATGFHDDAAAALPCYENMQGDSEANDKLQDSDNNGVIDSYTKDNVANGTYLEVEAYYVANRPEYKSQGKIIYRFMLGHDAVRNFDVTRNHHYKVTLRFKGYGNDIDWHIEYAEKYLDVTHPADVNYLGKLFKPEADYWGAKNNGHDFEDGNVITVTSYETNGTTTRWIAPEISYTYYSYNNETGEWTPDSNPKEWLTLTEGPLSADNTNKQYTFTAARGDTINKTINGMFPSTTKGTKAKPHNLSNATGDDAVENTANCYMVGEAGWYSIPLVYGNGITDSKDNGQAYSPAHFVNHLNKHITSAYIADNTGINLSNISVRLIWQDAENLIVPDEVTYDPTLFGNKGGIKFHIKSICEGNAVIALIDNSAADDEYVSLDRGVYGHHGSTRAIWSWHIWATRFGFDFEKNIPVLNHEEQQFELMPVNLGWCSDNQPIVYFQRRRCEIKFKVGDNEITRTIEQYPHFALPRGNSPYYQWGRKDPFIGTNMAWGNKKRWIYEGGKTTFCDVWNSYNPPRLYNEPGTNGTDYKSDKRKTTRQCLDVLIKNPDKWHNAPRVPADLNHLDKGFVTNNESFDDLWSVNGAKTIYDPCPPGYQVGDDNVFTGFTTTGGNMEQGQYWNDVLESNMLMPYYDRATVNSQVLEIYTDPRKVQSIIFPVTGYRDYDDKAAVTDYPSGTYNGIGFVWTNKAKSPSRSIHLKFNRDNLAEGGDWKWRGSRLNPLEDFYNCDGFAVRPVAIPAASADK